MRHSLLCLLLHFLCSGSSSGQYDTTRLSSWYHTDSIQIPARATTGSTVQIAAVSELPGGLMEAREPIILRGVMKDAPCVRQWTPDW